MGWAKSAGTGRRGVTFQVAPLTALALRESPPAGIGPAPPAAEQDASSRRNRRALPVYDVATGQDLETPVNLDNTLLQACSLTLRQALRQAQEGPQDAASKSPWGRSPRLRLEVRPSRSKPTGNLSWRT